MLNNSLLGLIHNGKYYKFYKTKEWSNKRKQILERDHYECQKCRNKGKYSNADCIHHIKHLKDYPMLALEDSNLISLCNQCHNEEHPEKLYKNSSKRKLINEERW